MTSTRRKDKQIAAEREALRLVEASAAVANDIAIDELPPAKPKGHRTGAIAAILGVSEKTVTNLLKAKKQPGKPKLYGWRIGKVWFANNEQIDRYIEECKMIERGEEFP